MHFDEFVARELKSGVGERLLLQFMTRSPEPDRLDVLHDLELPLSVDTSFIGLEDRTPGTAGNWDYVAVRRCLRPDGTEPAAEEAGEQLARLPRSLRMGELRGALLFDHHGELVEQRFPRVTL